MEQVLLKLEKELKDTPIKYDSQKLSKMKIPDLCDIMKKNNLNLEKKVNGFNKKKTKQEMINELCEL